MALTPRTKALRRSDGILRHRREQLPWPAEKPFRILSIDGGGIRGILPATILAEFEYAHLNGQSAGSYFDLIAGTSTGGIIALGLSVGMTAGEILQMYVEHGEEIFPPVRAPFRTLKTQLRFLRSLTRYQYERQPLERELRRVFGDKLLGDAQRRLCVPSFDGFTEVNVFKTPHHPDFQRDWREEMVNIALATSAAPTFFSSYRNGDRHFADGGVWANNPVMVALVDVLSCYAVERDQIEILSIGCGESEMVFTEGQIRGGGLWHWREIISAAMHLAGQNAIGQAGLLIGRDRLIRIDAPAMPQNPIKLDDFQRARYELPSIGIALAKHFSEAVCARFFVEPAEAYRAFAGPRFES